jgi:hypothetical protein
LKRKIKRKVKEKEERERKEDERNEKRIKKRKKKRIRNQEAVFLLMKFNDFTITICFFLSPYLTERQDTSFSQVYSLLNNAVKIHTHKQSTVHTTVCVCHIPHALFKKGNCWQFHAAKNCTRPLNQMKKSGYDRLL